MCVITASTICPSFDLSKRLQEGKVIIMNLWARCKGRTAAAASVWMLSTWNIFTAAESG